MTQPVCSATHSSLAERLLASVAACRAPSTPSEQGTIRAFPLELAEEAAAALSEISPNGPAEDLLAYVRIDLTEAGGTRSMIECDRERLLGLLQKLSSIHSASAEQTPWDKCEYEVIAWEIDQGQIGISVRQPNGNGSAWAVEPNTNVKALLKDGLRYRWLRGATTDYTPMYQQAMCLEAMDEWIDKEIANVK